MVRTPRDVVAVVVAFDLVFFGCVRLTGWAKRPSVLVLGQHRRKTSRTQICPVELNPFIARPSS
jgi:hypothetical protein